MKLAFFALIACCAFVVRTEANLDDDMKELGALLPKTKIIAIAAKHMIFDSQFRNFKKFLGSAEFAAAWEKMLINKDFKAVVEYGQKSGFDMIGVLNKVAKFLKLKEYPTNISIRDVIMSRTVSSFVDEVVNALPKSQMSSVMKNKMTTSPEFKKLHDTVISQNFDNLVQKAINSPDLAEEKKLFESKGLDFNKLFNVCRGIVSWATEGQTRSNPVQLNNAQEQYVKDLINNNKVMIFGASYCQWCRYAKQLFTNLSFPYTSVDLDTMNGGGEITKILIGLTGIQTVPQVFINGKLIGGYSEVKTMYDNGTLRKILYG